MRLFKSHRKLRSDQKGNVLIMVAAAMPLLVGSAGLAIDTIQLSLLKRHLQRAADSAALAGAYAKAQSKDATAAANKALGFNDAFPLSSAAITQPTSGTHANRAVRVALTAERSLPFWSFFSSDLPVINVQATAALVYSGTYCMVSLDESNGTGITFAGNATVDLGCGVISNTTGATAVSAAGSANVTASPIAAVGGVPSSTVYKQPTLLLPYSLKQADPFEDIEDPIAPTPCNPKITDSYPAADPVAPGCYEGIDVNKARTFAAGTFYIVDDILLNANANLTAHGVTLVLTSTTPTNPTSFPSLAIDGNAKLDLTAPISGTYEGIVMHYDGRAPTASHMINGNSNSKFEGAFYFPTQDLTFNGHSGMATNCIQLVALHLTFEGNTKINNSCPSGGGAKAFDAEWVRLVA
jgi:Flp pilus assembly protein TadG